MEDEETKELTKEEIKELNDKFFEKIKGAGEDEIADAASMASSYTRARIKECGPLAERRRAFLDGLKKIPSQTPS